MLRMRFVLPIVKSGGKVRNPVDEIILAKSVLDLHDPMDFLEQTGIGGRISSTSRTTVLERILQESFLSIFHSHSNQ